MEISELNSGTLYILKSEDLEKFAESFANKILASKSEPPQNQEAEQPISQPEAIKFMGKSRQTLIKLRKKGVINGHVLGGRVYYFKSELIACLKKSL